MPESGDAWRVSKFAEELLVGVGGAVIDPAASYGRCGRTGVRSAVGLQANDTFGAHQGIMTGAGIEFQSVALSKGNLLLLIR